MTAPNGYRTPERYTTTTERVGYASVDDDRSIGQLLQDLADEGRHILQLELASAKSEMSEKVSLAGKHIGTLAAGGFVIYAGFLAILAAIIVGLGNLIPLWVSALIVGIVVALVGYLMVRSGMNGLKRTSLAPQRTTHSVKEDVAAIRDGAHSAPVPPGGE